MTAVPGRQAYSRHPDPVSAWCRFTSDWAVFPTLGVGGALVHALNASSARGVVRGDRDRSRPRCIPARTCRNSSISRARSSCNRPARPPPALTREAGMTMQQQVLPLTRHRAAGHRALSRAIICWWQRWSSAARRCSTSACGDGDALLQLLETRGHRRTRHRTVALRGGQPLRRQGSRGKWQGRPPTPTSSIIPDDAFDYVIPVTDPAGDAASRAWLLENLLRIGRRGPSCRFRISASGRCGCKLLVGGHMPRTEKPAGDLVRHAEHSLLAPSRISCSCGDEISTSRWRRRGRARSLRPPAAGQICPGWFLEHVRRAGCVFAQPAPGEGESRDRRPLRGASATKQSSFSRKRFLDCFASLAMTLNLPSTLGRAGASGRLRPSAMKRSSISLNRAGSSRLSTWPDFGNIASPDAGRCFFRNRLGSMQFVVLVAADDQSGGSRCFGFSRPGV